MPWTGGGCKDPVSQFPTWAWQDGAKEQHANSKREAHPDPNWMREKCREDHSGVRVGGASEDAEPKNQR